MYLTPIDKAHISFFSNFVDFFGKKENAWNFEISLYVPYGCQIYFFLEILSNNVNTLDIFKI